MRALAALLAVLLLGACGGLGPFGSSQQARSGSRAAVPAPGSPKRPARMIESASLPYKGLTDNPAYQWWVDPTTPQPDSWWGQAQTEATLRRQAILMRDLGSPLFRVELPWSFVAPTQPGGAAYDSRLARDPGWPGYRWERWDEIVSVAVASGIDLVPQVYFAPAWATGVPASVSGGPNAPPTSPQLYGDFVHALVTRYHDRIHYWELGNEPDQTFHSWGSSLPRYVELMLRPGYEAVREVDQGARVVLGGLSQETNLAGLYRAGAKPYFDIVSFHAYYPVASADATALGHVLTAMKANGDTAKPVWLTEFGMPTHEPAGQAAGQAGQVAADPVDAAAEARQASLIRGVFSGPGVRLEAIFFYQLHDTAVYDADGHVVKRVFWGLLSGDLSRRKAGYEAFREARGSRRPR